MPLKREAGDDAASQPHALKDVTAPIRTHATERDSARATVTKKGRREDDPSPAVAAGLRSALMIVGCAAVAAWFLLALVHLDDRYRVGHVQGHWMALAQYAAHGTLYPPLADGGRFGGTRHMPLPILVNATASRFTGEYLVSGKTVAIALFALLLGLLLTVMRQMRCPWPLAVALTGLLPGTTTGVLAGSAPSGDVLPVVLQMCAIVAASTALRRSRMHWMIAAGTFAGLAAFSKLTALWAVLAIVSWLALRRQWRPLVWCVASFVVTATLAFAVVEWVSDGRFLVTMQTLAFAGTGSPAGWLRAPNQLVFFAIEDAIAVWMIAPFAAVGALAAWRSSSVTVYHHALGWSLLFTLIVFMDVGAGFNQLLDPAVLTILALGYFASGLPQDPDGRVTLATVFAFVLLWAGITGVRGAVPDLREAVGAWSTGTTPSKYNPRPLASVVSPGEGLLAEDPGVPVLLGHTPVVLDAFMLRRLDEVQPRAVDPLLRRIEGGQFAHIVLINRVDEEDLWWRSYHFGLRVRQALREAYVFAGHVDGYCLYRPRTASASH